MSGNYWKDYWENQFYRAEALLGIKTEDLCECRELIAEARHLLKEVDGYLEMYPSKNWAERLDKWLEKTDES